MSDMPDTHALEQQVAVMEERMNMMQSDLAATLEGFERPLADRFAASAEREAKSAGYLSAAYDRMPTSRW